MNDNIQGIIIVVVGYAFSISIILFKAYVENKQTKKNKKEWALTIVSTIVLALSAVYLCMKFFSLL